MRVLPYVSTLGLWLVSAPTLLAQRVTGYVPRLYRYPFQGEPEMMDQPAARTTFYDAALEQHLARVDQFVVLGAGLDTRSYRLPADLSVQCFEVDTPRTQAFKRDMLRKAGIDASHVTFAAADFLKDDWFAKLVDSGFAPNRPSLFV